MWSGWLGGRGAKGTELRKKKQNKKKESSRSINISRRPMGAKPGCGFSAHQTNFNCKLENLFTTLKRCYYYCRFTTASQLLHIRSRNVHLAGIHSQPLCISIDELQAARKAARTNSRPRARIISLILL